MYTCNYCSKVFSSSHIKETHETECQSGFSGQHCEEKPVHMLDDSNAPAETWEQRISRRIRYFCQLLNSINPIYDWNIAHCWNCYELLEERLKKYEYYFQNALDVPDALNEQASQEHTNYQIYYDNCLQRRTPIPYSVKMFEAVDVPGRWNVDVVLNKLNSTEIIDLTQVETAEEDPYASELLVDNVSLDNLAAHLKQRTPDKEHSIYHIKRGLLILWYRAEDANGKLLNRPEFHYMAYFVDTDAAQSQQQLYVVDPQTGVIYMEASPELIAHLQKVVNKGLASQQCRPITICHINDIKTNQFKTNPIGVVSTVSPLESNHPPTRVKIEADCSNMSM